jgi:hypothetical protein
MNRQLYDIPRHEDLAAIQAWAAEPDNRMFVISWQSMINLMMSPVSLVQKQLWAQ